VERVDPDALPDERPEDEPRGDDDDPLREPPDNEPERDVDPARDDDPEVPRDEPALFPFSKREDEEPVRDDDEALRPEVPLFRDEDERPELLVAIVVMVWLKDS